MPSTHLTALAVGLAAIAWYFSIWWVWAIVVVVAAVLPEREGERKGYDYGYEHGFYAGYRQRFDEQLGGAHINIDARDSASTSH